MMRRKKDKRGSSKIQFLSICFVLLCWCLCQREAAHISPREKMSVFVYESHTQTKHVLSLSLSSPILLIQPGVQKKRKKRHRQPYNKLCLYFVYKFFSFYSLVLHVNNITRQCKGITRRRRGGIGETFEIIFHAYFLSFFYSLQNLNQTILDRWMDECMHALYTKYTINNRACDDKSTK